MPVVPQSSPSHGFRMWKGWSLPARLQLVGHWVLLGTKETQPPFIGSELGLRNLSKVSRLWCRYYDTNLTKAQCNVFTSDHTSTFNTSNITNLSPGGLGSNWCDAAFVAKLSFATNLSNIK
jgi:hypothetical protein